MVPASNPSGLSLTRGGITDRLARLLRGRGDARPFELALILAALGWLVPALLTLIEAALRGSSAPLRAFFGDYTTYARSLLSVPLLVLADTMVDLYVSDADARMRELVEPSGLDRLDAMHRTLSRWSCAPAVEVVMAILALLPAVLRISGAATLGGEDWYVQHDVPTPVLAAGWWYALVSVPLLPFLLFRWVWRYALWTWYLIWTSRLPLRLITTHPDGMAGLGFVGRAQGAFWPVVNAVTIVIASEWAESISRKTATPDSYWPAFLALLLGVIAIFAFPTLAFSWGLRRARVTGLHSFDVLVRRYHLDFGDRWVTPPTRETPLGTPDIQSLNDINGAFDTTFGMRITLLSTKGLTPVVLATVLPMAFPAAVSMPLAELAKRLVGYVL